MTDPILSIYSAAFLMVTSMATVAFGVDRIMNHSLVIGGAFFVAVGVLGVVLATVQAYFAIRHKG